MSCSLPVHVLCNTEGCFASENMNNARSESWPLVQRSYIKFTCYYSRWHNICFVMNVFSFHEELHSGIFACVTKDCRGNENSFLSVWLPWALHTLQFYSLKTHRTMKDKQTSKPQSLCSQMFDKLAVVSIYLSFQCVICEITQISKMNVCQQKAFVIKTSSWYDIKFCCVCRL